MPTEEHSAPKPAVRTRLRAYAKSHAPHATRYVLSSSVTFSIELAVLWYLMTQLHESVFVAITLSFMVGVGLNYLGARFLAFHGTPREFGRGYAYFFAVAGFGLVLINGATWLFLHWVNLLEARLLPGMIAGTIGYFLNAYVTFEFGEMLGDEAL